MLGRLLSLLALWPFNFVLRFIYFMCVSVLPLCMFVYHMHPWWSVRSPGTGVKDDTDNIKTALDILHAEVWLNHTGLRVAPSDLSSVTSEASQTF